MEPKSCAAGLMKSAAEATAVPLRVALAVPPGVALTDSEAVFAPMEDGLNRAVTVHVAEAARSPVHPLLTSANAAASGPESVTVRAPVAVPPAFVTVKVVSAPF